MQPLEFCDLAERLILNEKNPAGFRTAISRCYYGAFHQARDFLGRMPLSLVTANPHLEVIAILSNSGDVDVDDAIKLLRDLRDVRNVADYDLNDRSVENETLATRCLNEARDVIAKLNGCRLSTTRFAAVTTQARANANRLRGLPP
jgi:uncharacterized protein (UPF0332 family)